MHPTWYHYQLLAIWITYCYQRNGSALVARTKHPAFSFVLNLRQKGYQLLVWIRKGVSKLYRGVLVCLEEKCKFKTIYLLLILILCTRFVADSGAPSPPLCRFLIIPKTYFHAWIIQTAFLGKTFDHKVGFPLDSLDRKVEPRVTPGRIGLRIEEYFKRIVSNQIDSPNTSRLVVGPKRKTANFNNLPNNHTLFMLLVTTISHIVDVRCDDQS